MPPGVDRLPGRLGVEAIPRSGFLDPQVPYPEQDPLGVLVVDELLKGPEQEKREERGIYVRTASWSGPAEEAGPAYKNVDDVVEATERAGLSRRVVRLLPVGNVKG